jgi:hypothetical protein
MDPAVPLHTDLDTVANLLGSWSGTGLGEYPTIEPFDYLETVTFGHVGKPFLTYTQRTRSSRVPPLPLHAEAGYWRFPAAGRVEIVLAHPTGIVEVQEGTLEMSGGAIRVEVAATTIVGTATAKPISAVSRSFLFDGDTLSYDVSMAAVGQPFQHHLSATLRRD